MKPDRISSLAVIIAFATAALALSSSSSDALSLIHISEPTRPFTLSRMPSSA